MELVGGGVYANSFTMTGGTISGNTVTDISAATGNGSGGGVKTIDFTMTGGTISGNTASRYGGGVYSFNFNKTGGVIYGNDAANIADRNTAVNGGHAVYSGSNLYRNTTLGLDDDLSTNTTADWEQ